LKQVLIKSGIWTLGLTLLFLLVVWNKTVIDEVIIATIYFIILYFLFFSIGKKEIAIWFTQTVKSNMKMAVVFPTLLIFLYYSYVLIHGENPFQGTTFLLPFLIYFPTLVFVEQTKNSEKLNWLDFTTFTLFLLPITLVDFVPETNLPFSGGGFDSVYRIVIMLAIVYTFVVVRNLKDVGFFPIFKLKYLWTAIWVWLVFYAFVFAIGYAVDFFKFVGYNAVFSVVLVTVGMSVLKVFCILQFSRSCFFGACCKICSPNELPKIKVGNLFGNGVEEFYLQLHSLRVIL